MLRSAIVMPERRSYISLSPQEKREFLDQANKRLGKRAVILEKDIWLCEVLMVVFSQHGLVIIFKGGTSLAKPYNAINRFSEDVDLGFDYRSLGEDFDPFVPGISRNEVKRFLARQQLRVGECSRNVIVPALHARFGEATDEPYSIRTDDTGEKIWFKYPSVTGEAGDYLKKEVLLELGGRVIINPYETHTIVPDVASVSDKITFPSATVKVMPLSKTFWEKVTLLHVECNRPRKTRIPERYSRHLHDVARLSEHPAGQAALADRQMLVAVVRHKKVFFHSSYANYDECLAGRARLVPGPEKLAELREDYEYMRRAGFLNRNPLDFDTVIERVREVEKKVNLLAG